ncbi:MAG: sugar kinase [Elusimicrobia bacterium GWA2_61_42]|nr:MAG: sugar kinase [Elusimicrobia bacterium GWA2_61_42]OGR74532.1 MAG: sugar kinase [Elusimicrobia bacterium GWC2_61_25]
MKNTILVVGSVALDSVKTIHGSTTKALGGSAVHFSLSASQFSPVKMLGVVGEDFPKPFRSFLSRRNICLEGMEVLPGKTFHWKGKYDQDFKNATTIATHLNVFEQFKPKLNADHARCGVLFLANIDPDLQREVLEQMGKPRLVACDTMNYWITLKKKSLLKLLKKVDMLFVNEEEARQLTGEYNLIRAARLIMKMGPRGIVVKRGDAGAMLFFKDNVLSVPAHPIEKVVDPTGAGDTFAGGFMGYLAAAPDWKNFNVIRRAMSYGTVMSSFSVEDFSVNRVGRLSKAEICSRFNKYVGALHVK